MVLPLVQVAFGLGALTVGAEALIRGASTLALRWGVSPMTVGLTVVAFGTSAPETVVSLYGAWTGHSDVAVGNVVGSNLFNAAFILGLSALIRPLAVKTSGARQPAFTSSAVLPFSSSSSTFPSDDWRSSATGAMSTRDATSTYSSPSGEYVTW